MVENRETQVKRSNNLSLKVRDVVAAYTLLRIIVGINYFNHGVTRIFNIPGFMDAMVKVMQDSWIPEFLVRINAALVPPVELIVGALMIIGFWTRGALISCFYIDGGLNVWGYDHSKLGCGE